jgi:uncharacterized glyoxalase superfamily protein PhnB
MVSDAARAIEFYVAAFGAVEAYRLDGEAGRVEVALLTVDGLSFGCSTTATRSRQHPIEAPSA